MTISLNGTTGIVSDGGYVGDGINFADGTPVNTLVTTTGGTVGIGTSAPGAKLEVNGNIRTTAVANRFLMPRGIDGNHMLSMQSLVGGNELQLRNDSGSSGNLVAIGNGVLRFQTENLERMRIDTGGSILIDRTSAYSDGSLGTPRLQVNGVVGARAAAAFIANTTGAINIIGFVNPNGTVGAIILSGTSTAYNTSSDYRLKHDIAPMTNALTRVALLKPVTYKWNADNSAAEGFIAHELAEVCPAAVTGEKDAVGADGNPSYQGIDTSFLVATLTAAIQEQQAIIESLTARVVALESN